MQPEYSPYSANQDAIVVEPGQLQSLRPHGFTPSGPFPSYPLLTTLQRLISSNFA